MKRLIPAGGLEILLIGQLSQVASLRDTNILGILDPNAKLLKGSSPADMDK